MQSRASLRALILAGPIAALLATPAAHAATLYWDTNGTGSAGSGAATGTWGTDVFWTTDPTGANVGAPVLTAVTTNVDDLVFSAGTNGTTGTVTISGTQLAHSITFDDPVAITLSGGVAINLGSAAAGSGLFFTGNAANVISTPIILNSAATAIAITNSTASLQTIGDITGSAAGLQTLTVGATSTGGITLGGIIGNGGGGGTVGFTVNSRGTGVTTLTAANTYTGITTIAAGTLTLNRQTGSLSTSSALTFTGTGTFNMDNTGASGALTQTLGALAFSAGDGTVKTTRTASFDQAITFASLTRSAGGTGNFVNTGTNSATNGFVFTSAPTASQIIDPGYFYNGSSYAAYDSGGFVRGLIYGTDTNANASLTGAQTDLGTIGASIDTQYVATTATNSTSNTASAASTTLVVGNGALFNVGAPLTGTGIAANTYVTAISGNTLTLSQSATVATNATITPYNLVSAQTTGSVNTLNLSGVGSSLRLAASQTLSVNGILRSAGSNSVAGVISGGTGLTTVGSGGEMVVRTNTASDTLEIATPILANGANALTKSGAGTLTLSAANTYGGATVVAGGTLKLGGATLFSENFNTYSGTQNNTQYQTGLNVAHTGSVAGWSKSGAGTIHAVDLDPTAGVNWAPMFFQDNVITLTTGIGANTLGVTYKVDFDYGTAVYGAGNSDQRTTTADSLLVEVVRAAGTTLASNTYAPGAWDTAGNRNLDAGLHGTLTYVGDGSGVVKLRIGPTAPLNSGRFEGEIDNIFVQTFTDNLLPTSTALSVAAGATFDVAGANQTVASLADSGGGGGTVTSSSSGALTINPSSGSTTFSGVIRGQISLTKSGAGTQVLSGSNTYTGTTTVGAGTLNLGVAENVNVSGPLGKQLANAAGTIVLSGGTLQYSAANTNDYSGRFSTASSQAYNVDTNGQTVIWATALTSSGGTLNKSGAGTLTLSGANTYTGTTTISLGTLQANHATALGNAGNITFGGGTLQFSSVFNNATAAWGARIVSSGSAVALDTNGQNVIVSGNIDNTNTGGLTKSGAGNLTLTGTNTFSGTTTVSTGKLYLNGTNAGTAAISVAGGATLGGTGSASAATATVASGGIVEAGSGGTGSLGLAGLTFSGTGTVNISNVANYTVTPAINVTAADALTNSGTVGSVSLALLGTAPVGTGTAHLLQYTGTQLNSTAFNAFALNTSGLTLTARAALALVNNPGYVDLNYSLDLPVWSGAGDGNWVTSPNLTVTPTTNWTLFTNSSTQTNFIASDAPIFDDSATGVTTVTISSGDVSPLSVTFGNSTKNYVLQGANGITGSASLTKNGAGQLTITNTNSYTGGTTVTGGTVSISADNNLGNTSGALALGTGGTLQATATFSSSRAVTLNTGGGIFTQDVAGTTLTMAGAIGGTGDLTQSGPGTLILSGPNNYNGNTTLNGGTLTAGNVTAFGNGTGTITINGGSLDSSVASLVLSGSKPQVWNANFGFTGTNSLSLGIGAVNLGATGTDTTRTITANASTLTVGGIVSNGTNGTTIGLTKSGAGTVLLSNANTYSGATTVNAGILQAGGTTAFGPAASASLVFGAGSTGKVQLNGNSMTVIGLNTDATPGTPIVESGSGTAGTDTMTVNSATGNTYAGILQNGSTRLLALSKSGAGTLTLSGTNTYTGATTISAGTLQFNGSLGGAGAAVGVSGGTLGVGASANIARNVNVSSGAVDLAGTVAGTLTLTGGTVTTSGSPTVTTADFSAGTGTVNATNALAITNQINLAGGVTGTLTGAASFTAAGANLADNSVARTLSLSGGTLAVSGPSTLFTENFNTYSGTQNATQYQTGLNVAHTGSIAGWSKSGAGTIHAVDLDPTAGVNWAPMFFQDNVITLTTGIGANALGVTYKVDFDYGTGVYAGSTQRTTTADSLLVEVVRANTTTLASNTFAAGAWDTAGNRNLDAGLHGTLTYVGDGTGVVKLRIGPTAPFTTDRFEGEIDNIFVTQFGAGGPVNLPKTTIAATAGVSSTLDLVGSAGAHNLASLNLAAGSTSTDLLLANGASLTLNGDAGLNAISATGTAGQTASIMPGASAPSLIIAAGKNISVDSGVTLTVQPAISGGQVTKIGDGTLVLSGTNTYTGATAVNAGTLTLGTTGNIASSAVTVSGTGATLAGGTNTAWSSDTIAGGNTGALTVNGLGTVSPGGASNGGLKVSGNLSMQGTPGNESNLTLGITGAGANNTAFSNYDMLLVSGTVTLAMSGPASLVNLNLSSSFTASASDIYFLVKTIDDGTAISGKFKYGAATLSEGDTFLLNSQTYKITYLAEADSNSFSTGNDVAIMKAGQTYDVWAGATGYNIGGAATETADFDNDGLSNLLEYLLGTDPTVDSNPAITYSLDTNDPTDPASKNQIVFTRPGSISTSFPSESGIVYQVQASDDCLTWSNLTTPAVAAVNTDTVTVTDTISIGASSTGKRFIRLFVSKP